MRGLDLGRTDLDAAAALEDVLRERNPRWQTYAGSNWQVVSWNPDADVRDQGDDDEVPF